MPERVRVDDGRPVRVITDRHGLIGGAIVQAAGPWRTSGDWWAVEPCRVPGTGDGEPAFPPAPGSRFPSRSAWDYDEWDIAMADGTIYRLSVQREIGQWYLDGVVD